MEDLTVYLLSVTVLSFFVGSRANRLNRNPWSWGIASWVISPLGVWIVLEICGRKKVMPTTKVFEEGNENQVILLEDEYLVQDEAMSN